MSEILQVLREAVSPTPPKVVIEGGGAKWVNIFIDAVKVGYASCDPEDYPKLLGRAPSGSDAATKYWVGEFTYRGKDYRIGPTAKMRQLQGKIEAMIAADDDQADEPKGF